MLFSIMFKFTVPRCESFLNAKKIFSLKIGKFIILKFSDKYLKLPFEITFDLFNLFRTLGVFNDSNGMFLVIDLAILLYILSVSLVNDVFS